MATSMMACRWNWCAQMFPDPDSLRTHVEQDHVATALPVKRKDVALLRRAEDGISFQESIIPRPWLSQTEGSQSQPLATLNRVERAVMTDLVAPALMAATAQVPPPGQTPNQVQTSRSGASTPTHVSKPPLPMTFAEMRGTPSPVPSPVPSSPGATAIINKMRQNAIIPVTPRQSVPVSPHASPHTPNLKQSPSKTTSKGRRFSPYTCLTPPMGDDNYGAGGTRAAGVEDPDASMDIVESQLVSMDDINDDMAVKSTLGALQSQWQPQSQLPFDDSASFSVSTINPKQLHAPLSFGADSQPMIEGGSLDASIPPSRGIVQSTPTASQRHGTPSSASPPSPSALDISNITKTDSQESILPTPFRTSRQAVKDSESLSISQPSPLPAAGTSDLPDKLTSQAGSQESDLYEQELPFDPGYGYGYGGGHGESQQLQTQVMPASYESSSWSQG